MDRARGARAAIPRLAAQCFAHGGEDHVELARILRELDVGAANEEMCAVLRDHDRRAEWAVAIMVLGMLNARTSAA